MGNQLTGIAPSQILPVEHYLTDVPDHEYDSSLGSTRFFKVARARFKEGYTVVKVFVIHDPSLLLKTYKDDLDKIRASLQGCSNCLPFTKVTLSDKAGLLFRQYVKDSLYDRISTRPFMNAIEKKWIAFQLLCALNQAHKLGICHGDIKSENIMMTGWNWLLLTDFASYKPTYLPEDNPSDFSYFFDTSRRRTCYIAPERFVDVSSRNNDQTTNIDLTSTSVIKPGKRTAAMDIFSAGCVLTELFTDGTSPFDLSQLLLYRTGEYTPWKVLEKIEDTNIRDLAKSMMQKDPKLRLSAEEYLIEQKGRGFPDYFYTFLKLYLQRFVIMPVLPADDRVIRVRRDLTEIIKHMDVDTENPCENNGLVIVISLLTSSMRALKFCSSKLIVLDCLLTLSQYVTSEVILDRMIPFMLYLVDDPFPRVRAHVIRTVTKALGNVKTVPRNDANIFPEYLLPTLSELTHDDCVIVRESFAENIALLAETAQHFLEIVHLSSSSSGGGEEEDDSESQYEASYDMELEGLHEMIQQIVVVLLTDSENIVKQTLLARGITRLCVFFGRQKANDVLLSHMITFLNDKHDWYLRGAFFDAIVGVAAYVGWQSTSILLPLLQQGLSDTEEFVISKTLCAMISLTDLGLLQKTLIHDLLREVVPFLTHPNLWIRQGAVGCVAAVAKSLNIADVHCNLLPLLQPFLKQPVLQIDKEVVLLNALESPIPRAIYDYVLRSQLIEKLFECLYDKQLQRSVTRHGHRPQYPELEDNLNQMFRKLGSMGLTEADEDKLLALKEFMMKLHRARAGSADSSLVDDESVQNGLVNIFYLKRPPTRRHADLFKEEQIKKSDPDPKKMSKKKSQASDVNEEWRHMFGTSDSDKSQPHMSAPLSSKSKIDSAPQLAARAPISRQASLPSVPTAAYTMVRTNTVDPGTMAQMVNQPEQTNRVMSPPSAPQKVIEYKYSVCKLELRNLVYSKREQYAKDCVTKDLMEGAIFDDKPPPPSWKPKGLLVAHLHEHRAAINRIVVSQDHTYFATCSSDGNVKLWEGQRMDGKSITNRSKFTYSKQGGQIKTATFCEGSQSFASASDNGTIHVVRIDEDKMTNSKQLRLFNDKDIGVQNHGHIVDMTYFDTGAQSVIAYATANGELIGWDLRSSKDAWILKNNPRHGLITSFDVHHNQSWLCAGTSSGTFVCWDMRFQLPISVFNHSTNSRVRRLLVHPQKSSWFVSSMQGNNEVSMWDIETAHREKTLWASCAPVFSTKEASNHSINGLHMGLIDGTCPFVLTAGSDMRIRYWDLNNPESSYIVVGAASDPANQTPVSYKPKVIDGTEVIQETYSKAKPSGQDDIPRRGPDAPPQGHHDIISDINMYQTGQCFIVTSSRDGVVKVWK